MLPGSILQFEVHSKGFPSNSYCPSYTYVLPFGQQDIVNYSRGAPDISQHSYRDFITSYPSYLYLIDNMSGYRGDLIDFSTASPISEATRQTSNNSRTANNNELSRTSTRESYHSNENQDGAVGITGLLNSTLSLFGKRKESLPNPDLFDNAPSSSRSNDAAPSLFVPVKSPDRQIPAVNSEKRYPQDVSANLRSPLARSRPALGMGYIGSSNESRSSQFSNQSASTARTTPSPGLSNQPNHSAQTDDIPQTAMTMQARLRTLPRLESYRLTLPEITPRTLAESRDSENEAEEEDSSAGRSATETGHDTEDTELEEEEDEDEEDDGEEDRPHDEEDARGGVIAMNRTMARPALPTLNSTRGFSRTGPISPLQNFDRSPFAAFSGWTTFASSTPTPGPLRTTRPTLGDNPAGGSYFDARPSSSARTPAQTPLPLNGDLGTSGRNRSFQAVHTPGASPSPQISRFARQQVTPQRKSAVSSPLSSHNMQYSSTSAITSIPEASASITRPSFYQRQSRSLVDLSRTLESSERVLPPVTPKQVTPRPLTKPKSSIRSPIAEITDESPPVPAIPSVPDPGPSPARSSSREVSPTRQSVQRRQSMPEMRIDPPVYSVDDDFFVQYRKGMPLPVAREEVGHEPLPKYTCDVHIEGYVPRKLEFTKPGLQSKDRKWKRQYLILHGTSVKVYKTDPRIKAVLGQDAPPSPGIYKADYKPTFPNSSIKPSSSTSAAQQRSRRMTDASVSSTSTTSTTSTSASGNSEKSMEWTKRQSAIDQRQLDPDIPVHVHLHEDSEGGLASFQNPGAALLAKASENRCIRHYTLQGEQQRSCK